VLLSVDDCINRAAVDTGAAFGALISNAVDVTGLHDSTQGASINTGTTADAFFGNLESHFFLLVVWF
jgi:hypothetical protein